MFVFGMSDPLGTTESLAAAAPFQKNVPWDQMQRSAVAEGTRQTVLEEASKISGFGLAH